MRQLILFLVIAILAPSARAATTASKRLYQIASGDAVTTLKQFVEQSGEQIIYVVPKVRGVLTNPANGEFTAHEALSLMLAGTQLVVMEDKETGALMINRSTPQETKDKFAQTEPKLEPPTETHHKPMKRKNPITVLAAMFAMAFTPAHAADAPAAATGAKNAVISGTVLNENTQKYLERATVTIKETQQQVLTDREGTFRLAGLPAGTYTVVASYTDLEDVSRTVTVAEAETATVDFTLTSGVYVLGQVVVTSTREGTAYAINQQRRAESSRSVTSVDAFIDRAAGNPGEFLKNIEGIQMDYSQNEPQTIRVRGIDPNLTTVTMDGNEIASASSSSANRAVQIDQLSMGSIDNAEVFKAPVPWMSANAIGGAVNFNSKSAFDQKGQRASVQFGVNMDSNDFNFDKTPGPGHGDKAERRVYPTGRLSYSNSFFDNRLGVVFTMGYDYTNQLASSTTHNLRYSDPPGDILPPPATGVIYSEQNAVVRRAAFSMAPNRQLRLRSDFSLNFDYKLSDTITLTLKNTFSNYKSTNRNHGFTLTPNTLVAGSNLLDYTTTNGTASMNASVFDKFTKTWQISPGAKFRSGDWKIELAGGFSKSINHYTNADNFGSVNLSMNGTSSWRMVNALDTDVPAAIELISGTDFYDLNNYRPNQTQFTPAVGHLANHNGFTNNNVRHTNDVKYSSRLDVQRDIRWFVPINLRAGLAYNEHIFDKKQPQQRFYWLGDDGLPNTADDNSVAANLGRFAEPVRVSMQIPGWKLREPTYISGAEVFKYWQDHPQVMVENAAYAAQQRIAGRQKVNERISAAYLASLFTVKKLDVVIGLRVEQTKLVGEGYRVDATTPAGLTTNTYAAVVDMYHPTLTKGEYTGSPFKYLHLKYDITKNLLVRGSYTDAIGRPNLGDVLPNNVSINESTKRISSNRGGLRPQRSKNLDFSVEYYTKSAGQWTAGWFQRDIKQFISDGDVQLTQSLADELLLDYNNYQDYRLTSKFNLGYAKWSGVEAKFSQSLSDFSFVPKALQGIRFWGNYTKNYKMEGDYGTPGRKITKLANTVPWYYNAGIAYRTPGGDFTVQFSTNYQAKKPTQNMPATTTAGQANPEQLAYQFYNMEMSYRVTKQFTLSAIALNLFSERPTFTDIGIVRNTQQATGIAWTFTGKYSL